MAAPENISRLFYRNSEGIANFIGTATSRSHGFGLGEHLEYFVSNILIGGAIIIYHSVKGVYRVAELICRTVKTIFAAIAVIFTLGLHRELRYFLRDCAILNVNSIKRVALFLPQLGCHLTSILIGLIPFSAPIALPFGNIAIDLDRSSDDEDATLQENILKEATERRERVQRENVRPAQIAPVQAQEQPQPNEEPGAGANIEA